MIKKSFFVACLSFVAVASFSQVKIKDVRTNPDLYFLRADEVASSLNLLPAPPQPGSILFMNDEAQYKWGKLQRDTPRGDQAAADAVLMEMECPMHFQKLSVYRYQKKQLLRFINWY